MVKEIIFNFRKLCHWSPTLPGEVQPLLHWFPPWHLFRRTEHHMPGNIGFPWLITLKWIETLEEGKVDLGTGFQSGKGNLPWPASHHAQCPHSAPLGVPLEGPPCSQ